MFGTSSNYIVLNKTVGQTPLDVIKAYKAAHPQYADVPMAYAGRLDPMASGRLLILIGDECRQQEKWHGLDKEYIFEILLGVSSDSGDVLGIIKSNQPPPTIETADLKAVLTGLRGHIALPYPRFSAYTVRGKPLHTWTLEGKLDEIEIPIKHSSLYRIKLELLTKQSTEEIYLSAQNKINSLPPVTEPRKALGEDFRRPYVRDSWQAWREKHPDQAWPVARLRCAVSSGTYMRSLAEAIAKHLDTTGLAFSIERSKIGRFRSLGREWGVWWPVW